MNLMFIFELYRAYHEFFWNFLFIFGKISNFQFYQKYKLYENWQKILDENLYTFFYDNILNNS